MLSPAARPGLLIATPPDGRPGWLAEAVAILPEVAAVVPDLPVAVAAPRAGGDSLCADPRCRPAGRLPSPEQETEAPALRSP